MERRGSWSAGYVVVLPGAVTFIVDCFHPYWGVTEPTSASLSFYRLFIPEGIGSTQRVGGFLILFGGVTTPGSRSPESAALDGRALPWQPQRSSGR